MRDGHAKGSRQDLATYTAHMKLEQASSEWSGDNRRAVFLRVGLLNFRLFVENPHGSAEKTKRATLLNIDLRSLSVTVP